MICIKKKDLISLVIKFMFSSKLKLLPLKTHLKFINLVGFSQNYLYQWLRILVIYIYHYGNQWHSYKFQPEINFSKIFIACGYISICCCNFYALYSINTSQLGIVIRQDGYPRTFCAHTKSYLKIMKQRAITGDICPERLNFNAHILCLI